MRAGGLISALLVLGLFGALAVGRCFVILGYPLVGGGHEYNKAANLTAKSLAIIERPFWGREKRYYRFELREGRHNGTLLRSLIVQPIQGEDFRMPRGGPAFPIRWNENGSVSFEAQGVQITFEQ